MKPAPFDYCRPESLEEALEALAGADDGAKVLAGGQSLVPALNMRLVRPTLLIDLNHVSGIDDVSSANGVLRVGATARQADPRLGAHPLLAEVLPHVGHFVTRNRGTIGGSIAHADPAAELPLALVTAGGTVVVASRARTREIPAGDFFLGLYTTALDPGEIVVETVWPEPREDETYAFEEFAQRGGDYALAMAAARVRRNELRVVVGSVVERPTALDVDPEHPGESAAAQVEPWGSIHGTPAYLKQLVRVLVDRAVARARGKAEAKA